MGHNNSYPYPHINIQMAHIHYGNSYFLNPQINRPEI